VNVWSVSMQLSMDWANCSSGMKNWPASTFTVLNAALLSLGATYYDGRHFVVCKLRNT
jgi:hypothetical protein